MSIPPNTYLQVALDLQPSSSNIRHLSYTMTFDVRVDLSKLERPVSLYQACWPDQAEHETDEAYLWPDGTVRHLSTEEEEEKEEEEEGGKDDAKDGDDKEDDKGGTCCSKRCC